MTSLNPVGVALFVAVALWLARMWFREAKENPQGGGGLPGASSCPARAVAVAVAEAPRPDLIKNLVLKPP